MKKCRLLAALLAAVTCLSVFSTLAVSAADYDAAYDVNGDGAIDTKDLTRLMKFISGQPVEIYASDMTGDGKTDTKDLTRLMKYLAGIRAEENKKSFDQLAEWIKANGTESEGIYILEGEPFSDERGSVYAVSLTYDPEYNDMTAALASVSNAENSSRYGLMVITALHISPELLDSDKAEYIIIHDDKEFSDMGLYLAGEINGVSGFSPASDISYDEAVLGEWDEAEMLDYAAFSVCDTLCRVSDFLGAEGSEITLGDLGFRDGDTAKAVYSDAYNALLSWLLENTEFINGYGCTLKKIYTYGGVDYSVSIMYSTSDVIKFAMDKIDDPATTTCILLYRDGSAVFDCHFDATSTPDHSGVADGSVLLGEYSIQTALTYNEIYSGEWTADEAVSYTVQSLEDMLSFISEMLAETGCGVGLRDFGLGFAQ